MSETEKVANKTTVHKINETEKVLSIEGLNEENFKKAKEIILDYNNTYDEKAKANFDNLLFMINNNPNKKNELFAEYVKTVSKKSETKKVEKTQNKNSMPKQ